MTNRQIVQVAYKNGTYGTAFRSLVLDMKESVEALERAGFKKLICPTDRNVWPSQVYDALMRIEWDQKHLLESGQAQIRVRDYREYVNPANGDFVAMTDFDFIERGVDFKDPGYFVLESVPGRTSKVVMEILSEELRKKFVRITTSEGFRSRRANRCIAEYSEFTGKTLEQAATDCIKMKQRIDAYVDRIAKEEERFARSIMRKTVEHER